MALLAYQNRARGAGRVIERRFLRPAVFGSGVGDISMLGLDVRIKTTDQAQLAADGLQKADSVKTIDLADLFPSYDPAIHDVLVHLFDLSVIEAVPEFYVGVGLANPATEVGRGIYWGPEPFKVGVLRETSTYESTKSTQTAQPTQITGQFRLSPATLGVTTQALVGGTWFGGETDDVSESGLAAAAHLYLAAGHSDSDDGPSEVYFQVAVDLIPKLSAAEPTS